MISIAVIIVRQAARNAATSSSPSSLTNFIRLIDARLHAESSRNMYSEQGLLALMRAVFGEVCHSLTVVSNCMPGSPHTQVPSAIDRIKSRARYVSTTSPVVTARVCHNPSSSTARMNSSVTRTELFEFWKNTEPYAVPVNEPSYPASMSAHAFFSSSTLQLMNSRMSGCSALRITIFAARRVLPPDLMTPAKASKPFMNDTGPEAVPPPASSSFDDRIADRLLPVPEPNLKSMPSVLASVRIDSIVSSTALMKQAEHCGACSKPQLNQTGLLKAAFCSTSRCFRSPLNADSASS